MCGRFTITTDQEYLEQRFKASFSEKFNPRFNAAPSQSLPIIKNDSQKRIDLVQWGIKPKWLQKMKGAGVGLINVRDDNLKLKRTFEKDLLHRRCLVLADGFYEWQKIDGKKIPMRFVIDNNEPFAMAGIWEENEDQNGNEILTFAIITTEANRDLKKVHNRMPVILEREEEEMWLGDHEKNDYLSLLDPLPLGLLEAYEVSLKVNNVMNDGPEIIKKK